MCRKRDIMSFVAYNKWLTFETELKLSFNIQTYMLYHGIRPANFNKDSMAG
jgi:hypothetical protein